jgi:hypothetical protein
MSHELRRNESGHLACPGCSEGRDEVKLNRLNAEYAQRAMLKQGNHKYDGGGDPNVRNLEAIHRTTAADILLLE